MEIDDKAMGSDLPRVDTHRSSPRVEREGVRDEAQGTLSGLRARADDHLEELEVHALQDGERGAKRRLRTRDVAARSLAGLLKVALGKRRRRVGKGTEAQDGTQERDMLDLARRDGGGIKAQVVVCGDGASDRLDGQDALKGQQSVAPEDRADLWWSSVRLATNVAACCYPDEVLDECARDQGERAVIVVVATVREVVEQGVQLDRRTQRLCGWRRCCSAKRDRQELARTRLRNASGLDALGGREH